MPTTPPTRPGSIPGRSRVGVRRGPCSPSCAVNGRRRHGPCCARAAARSGGIGRDRFASPGCGRPGVPPPRPAPDARTGGADGGPARRRRSAHRRRTEGDGAGSNRRGRRPPRRLCAGHGGNRRQSAPARRRSPIPSPMAMHMRGVSGGVWAPAARADAPVPQPERLVPVGGPRRAGPVRPCHPGPGATSGHPPAAPARHVRPPHPPPHRAAASARHIRPGPRGPIWWPRRPTSIGHSVTPRRWTIPRGTGTAGSEVTQTHSLRGRGVFEGGVKSGPARRGGPVRRSPRRAGYGGPR